MAVLDRSDLEASSLADLHSIAGQIGLDGFRRLRKADLVELILDRHSDGGSIPAPESARAESESAESGSAESAESAESESAESESESGSAESESESDSDSDSDPEPAASMRRRRGSRRARSEDSGSEAAEEESPAEEPSEGSSRRTRSGRTAAGRTSGSAGRTSGRSARGSTGRQRASAADVEDDEDAAETGEEQSGERGQASVEGEVEVLGNGSAFLRLAPPGSSDDDVYISAAQVRRCELVAGDRVSGPVRRPRRSERYPSLARVDTINGEAAEAGARTVKYDSLPASFPNERFELSSEDVTLEAIGRNAPIGRGSRVSIVGLARAGKTETLRRLLGALAAVEGLESTLLLLGTRPEELREWEQGPVAPAASLTFAASADAQGQALEHAIDTAKRVASRGGDALVAIDSLDGVHPHVARRALAAAKNIEGSGSLTVIATATRPFGGESTVIALDATRTSTLTLPALDLLQSGTLRPELLVGEDAAAEIVKARLALVG